MRVRLLERVWTKIIEISYIEVFWCVEFESKVKFWIEFPLLHIGPHCQYKEGDSALLIRFY